MDSGSAGVGRLARTVPANTFLRARTLARPVVVAACLCAVSPLVTLRRLALLPARACAVQSPTPPPAVATASPAAHALARRRLPRSASGKRHHSASGGRRSAPACAPPP